MQSRKERKIKTVSLERELLKYLLKDKMYLQRMYGICKQEWFTNIERTYIYNKIKLYFEENKSLLTKEQFEYELDKDFDKQSDEIKIKALQAQFEICCNSSPTQELDLIVSKFNEVDLATDINDVIVRAYEKLQSGSIDDAASILKSGSLDLNRVEHKGRVISLHNDVDDWVDQIINRKEHPQKYAGIPTGFPTLDKQTGGLFKAQLTVIFGLSGKGKSTLMKSIGSNIRKKGYNVLHCGNEENEFQMRTKYQSLESQIPYRRLKLGMFSDAEFEKWKRFNIQQRVRAGGLYIYEFPQATDATMIERAVAELKLKGVHIDVIIVDYMDLMSPTHKAYSENDEQGKVTKDLKQLAINCDCPVLTCTQAGIQAEKQETKERPFLSASDVFGTKQKVHSANCLLGIVNQTATVGVGERSEEERKIHKLVICCPKNRDGSIFTFRCKMYVTIGKVEEDLQKDSFGQAVQKQTMQMMDETKPDGQMRSAIDLKQIYKNNGNELKQKVNDIMQEISQKENQFEKEKQVFDSYALNEGANSLVERWKKRKKCE